MKNNTKGRFHMSTAYIGRQPIYNPSLEIAAYELLFRQGDENNAHVTNGTSATSDVMFNAFVEIGLESIVGNKSANIKVSPDFFDSDLEIPFPPENGHSF